MKRLPAFMVTLVLLAALAACGAKPVEELYIEPETEPVTETSTLSETTTEELTSEETTVEETTVEETTEGSATAYQPDRSDFMDKNASGATELLEACWKARFDPESSGHILRDLNGDGQPEMLVFERIPAKNRSAETTALYYFVPTGNKAVVSDVLVQRYMGDGAATSDIYDETLHGDYRGEAQEVFLTEENIICISRFMSHMAWSADYDIYQIRNNKFVWVKGITDPGYTGGIGLYLDNEDGYDYEDGALYAVDADGSGKEGKYDSYKQAINSELNPYGFTLYKNGQDGYGGSGKYQIAETKKVQKIYGFSIYATIEDFENEDKGI